MSSSSPVAAATVLVVDQDGAGLPAGLTLTSPEAALAAPGASRATMVAEVALEPGAAERVAGLRAQGLTVGVCVPPHPARPSADAGERGRILGLLTAALLAGATVVRTDDVAAARRVVAVVATLEAAAEPTATDAPTAVGPDPDAEPEPDAEAVR